MGILGLLLILGIYFIPSLVGRNKDNFTAIFLLNFFLGWTLIGWVVALVWAATNDRPQMITPLPPIPRAEKPSSVSDELTKLAVLKERGIITDEEFQMQKAKILNK